MSKKKKLLLKEQHPSRERSKRMEAGERGASENVTGTGGGGSKTCGEWSKVSEAPGTLAPSFK